MSIKRLDFLLSNSGFGSRRDVKKILKTGAVKVDNILCKDPSLKVDISISTLLVNDRIIEYKEFLYLIMNKPKGVISATFDNYHKTVLDILPDKYKSFDLFPVGRLDIDTEGLLLLTNDGHFSYNLLSPKKHVSKTYYAIIDADITSEDVHKFKTGVTLEDGYKTMPAELIILDNKSPNKVEIIIFEGKFHQVKRMFKSIGKTVTYLKRIKMSSLKLDSKLKLGECRELFDLELKLLQNI